MNSSISIEELLKVYEIHPKSVYKYEDGPISNISGVVIAGCGLVFLVGCWWFSTNLSADDCREYCSEHIYDIVMFVLSVIIMCGIVGVLVAVYGVTGP